MRKMADKLGHITSPRPASSGAISPSSPSIPYPAHMQQQLLHNQPLHSPSASLSSTQSTALSSAGQRPSASTERTSVSEWKSASHKAEQTDQMNVDVQSEPVVPLQVRRPTGTYRLSDFIIQRTLGTGSFGRVHLGASARLLNLASPHVILCSAKQAQLSFLRRQSLEQGEDRPHETGLPHSKRTAHAHSSPTSFHYQPLGLFSRLRKLVHGHGLRARWRALHLTQAVQRTLHWHRLPTTR